jgi:3-isopropylmalate/(R)-2-methylmalate dehydratase small subunit
MSGAGPIEGRVWAYGDHVDTDVIIPARYLVTADPAELGRHCMEDLDGSFVSSVRPGDVIVAGENFGCGSSREHAPLAIRGSRVGAVVASSFARIFFRNAINVGLPIFECPEAVKLFRTGGRIEIDPEAGTIRDPESGTTLPIRPLPEFLRSLYAAGGLVPYVRTRLEEKRVEGGSQA